jgi:hypothetical protein
MLEIYLVSGHNREPRVLDQEVRHTIYPLSIKNMVRPTTRKELRRFIGMVNYYSDMWVRMSELLAPLTSMTSKNVNLNWIDEHQKALKKINKRICREVMLTTMCQQCAHWLLM